MIEYRIRQRDDGIIEVERMGQETYAARTVELLAAINQVGLAYDSQRQLRADVKKNRAGRYEVR